MSLVSPPKNPIKVAAGRAGAEARWGPGPRVVRIDSLSNEQRAIVLALLDAAKKAAIADHDDGPEERGHSSATHP